jgi:hypothetical protein
MSSSARSDRGQGTGAPERRIGWSQPLCEPCFAAWCLGKVEVPREPARLVGGTEGDPCCVCGTTTTIYARIDPAITSTLRFAKEKA